MKKFLAILLVAAHLLLPATAAPFKCNANATATNTKSTCQALIGYIPPNATTLAAIKSLFQIKSLRSLLGANGLPLSTPVSRPVPARSTVRIRFSCKCSNGTGASNRKPIYKVKAGDGLDAIARNYFNGFVTYQEIAAANNISDPNQIEVGQALWIPLPCSCDRVDGAAVVHYGHVVAAGSSVAEIAGEFGVAEATLMRLNGISDPKELQAAQILDVPLRACSSSISNISADRDLRVPNGSYALTANNCVLCSCSSPSWQLECHPTQGIASSCPAANCGSLNLGNTSSTSACESSTCAYAGYTKITILTNLTTQSSCNNAGSPLSQPTSGSVLRFGLQGLRLMELLYSFPWLCFVLIFCGM